MSGQAITAPGSTSAKSAILSRMSRDSSSCERQTTTSGWMPMRRSSFTECCVGFVFSSPAASMNGTSVTWTYMTFSGPTSRRNWRIASRNGSDSMSPTVPPISEMTTSVGPDSAARRMRALISFVMCGITCTVAPRKSPLRSLRRTVSQIAPALWLALRRKFSSTKRS